MVKIRRWYVFWENANTGKMEEMIFDYKGDAEKFMNGDKKFLQMLFRRNFITGTYYYEDLGITENTTFYLFRRYFEK